MAIERRGFNSAIWGTSYNQFFGYPPESFRFIEPYTPHVDALKETQLRNGAQAATESSEKPKYLPLADCAVSHGARCILAAANAIDMDPSFVAKYIQVQPLNVQADGTFDPFWVKLIKIEYGFEEEIREAVAMMKYMCTKFSGSDCYIYPTSNINRIFKIDSKLSFDLTQMQPSILTFVGEAVKSHSMPKMNPLSSVFKNLAELEAILERQKYVADDQLSLADISMVTSVTMLEIVQFDFSEFKAIQTWMRLVKSLPFYRVSNFSFEDYTKDAISALSK